MKFKTFGFSTILLLATVASAQQTPAPRPDRVRVSSKVAEGLVTHRVDPKYPKEARAQHVEGDVVLKVIIDKQGKLSQITILSGNVLLIDAAVEAMKQWTFRPYLLNGDPVEVESTTMFRFNIR